MDRLRRPLAFAGRVVLWATVALVLARGVVALFESEEAPAPPAPAAATGGPVDTVAAEALAVQFVTDYLERDPEAGPEARAETLAPYVADGVDLDLGFAPSAPVAVTDAVVAGTTVDGTRATIVVAVQIGSGRWLHLAVPLAVGDSGTLAVVGLPALVPRPAAAGTVTTEDLAADPALTPELEPTVESFMRAYGSGDQAAVDRFLLPETDLASLDGTLEVASVETFAATPTAEGSGASGRVTVRWVDPATGAGFTSTYELVLMRQAERWYVAALGPVRD